MQKFFVESNQINIEDFKIHIIGEDVNHIKNVLRFVIGEHIEVCDKSNNINKYLVKISDITKDKIECDIVEKIQESKEPNVSISIFQGLPKADKMDFIVQKCTEIGVVSLTPVEMQRSIVKFSSIDSKKKIDRWQKIAETAAKQSGRDIIPKVNEVINIDEFADICEKFDLVIVAYEDEKNNFLKHELRGFKGKDIAVLVGPEGGITNVEIEILIKTKAKIISLGKRILRTETAPIAISSIILYELGDMGE